MKRIFVIMMMLISLGVFLINSCTNKEEEVIKIGAILPLTGDAAKYGEIAKNGIELALDEINSEGGINGKNIVMVYEDTKGDPKLGVTAIQKLITINKVKAIIGDLFSSVTLAVAPIANKNKIVLLSPASSSPKITNAGDFIFRNCPSDVYEGSVMANHAYDILNYRKVALLYINNDYGLGIKNVFGKVFSEKGGAIVTEEAFDQNSNDFKSQLLKIKNKNPEAIYLVGYKKMGHILKQTKEMGIQSQFLSTVMFEDPEILEIAKNSAEGVIYSASAFNPESDESLIQDFVQSYENKYNQVP
ncbi:MAG: ABC transporter substrate-binding protein, partial [Candidatus Delongbacteria bacterium]|nr:ABC transporter substrate-binding protein [Candidatus Delongbacteria bacterium]